MPVRTVIASVLLLGTLGTWSLSARAETAEEREACTPDVYAHCGDYIPNRDAIVVCLKQKLKLLSPACRKVMLKPFNPKASQN
jgi:hypothetical protein